MNTSCVACQVVVAADAAACPGCGLPFRKAAASGGAGFLCALSWLAAIGVAATSKSDIQLILAAVLGVGGIAWLAALRTTTPIKGTIKTVAVTTQNTEAA